MPHQEETKECWDAEVIAPIPGIRAEPGDIVAVTGNEVLIIQRLSLRDGARVRRLADHSLKRIERPGESDQQSQPDLKVI